MSDVYLCKFHCWFVCAACLNSPQTADCTDCSKQCYRVCWLSEMFKHFHFCTHLSPQFALPRLNLLSCVFRWLLRSCSCDVGTVAAWMEVGLQVVGGYCGVAGWLLGGCHFISFLSGCYVQKTMLLILLLSIITCKHNFTWKTWQFLQFLLNFDLRCSWKHIWGIIWAIYIWDDIYLYMRYCIFLFAVLYIYVWGAVCIYIRFSVYLCDFTIHRSQFYILSLKL